MTNKEFIQEEIYWLEDLLEQAKRDNRNAVIPELEEEIEQYNQVLKDLEELEKYKKVMCEPILDIMKKLEILDIIKSWLLENVEDYTNEEHPNYFIDVFIRDDEPIFNIIMEVLKNENNNL